MVVFLFQFHLLKQFACFNQVACNGIEHTIDIAGTAWRRVELSQLNELVDSYADGDAGECEHLCNGNLHDDNIHVGQTGEVPILRSFCHHVLIIISIKYSGSEEFACIVFLFLRVVFGQQLLLVAVLFLKTLDSLQYECVNDILVIIPVETLLFQK